MTDEPTKDDGDGRPKFFKSVTGWIGGLTAVVLALAGLKAASGQLDLFGSSEPKEAKQAESTESGGGAGGQVAKAAETAALPTSYTGVWQDNNVKLEWRNGVWVETTEQGGGEEDPLIYHYEQLSRTPQMTNTIDRSRNLYVRWPTDGGTVEESEDGDTWTRSYELTKA